MRMVDLRKGVIYAWKTGYSSDIRRLENFVKVEYVGPAPAQYDRYRPDKKMNKGRVRVKLLQEHRAFERWGNDNPEVQKIGTVVEIDAKAIQISWDDMVEAAGETHAAALQAEAYMKSLVDLVKEVDPKLVVDHAYSRSYNDNDRADIQVNLRYGGTDKEFDPSDAQVSMSVEVFRKLLSGVKV